MLPRGLRHAWRRAKRAVRGFSACRQRVGITVATALSACLLAVIFVPGGGLRTTWACIRNGNDLAYNLRRFTKSIVDELPADAH